MDRLLSTSFDCLRPPPTLHDSLAKRVVATSPEGLIIRLGLAQTHGTAADRAFRHTPIGTRLHLRTGLATDLAHALLKATLRCKLLSQPVLVAMHHGQRPCEQQEQRIGAHKAVLVFQLEFKFGELFQDVQTTASVHILAVLRRIQARIQDLLRRFVSHSPGCLAMLHQPFIVVVPQFA